MAGSLNRLTARAVASLSESGRHADGGGLYFVVGPGASRRWVFFWKRGGRRREMGLGSARDVSLAAARLLATEARAIVAAGGDPIEARNAPAGGRPVPTFGEAADAFIATAGPSFRSGKHLAQWRMTLSVYAAGLRPKPVDEITTADVLAVLKPLWQAKQETASRLRGRIERVLNAAKAEGHRSGENPAAWRGHLENLLPRRHRLSRRHHAAMAYREVPAFLAGLRRRQGLAAKALEFTILTAARSGEVRGMRWSEVDLAQAVWTIPAERMKAAREHRVPLTARTLAILEEAALLGSAPEAFVFPGQRRGRPLCTIAMETVLKRMKIAVTVHGFRSSFRDFAGNETGFPREIAEAALAHVVGDPTERAYRRDDALEKRRKLMDAWARYLEPRAPGTVVPLARAG